MSKTRARILFDERFFFFCFAISVSLLRSFVPKFSIRACFHTLFPFRTLILPSSYSRCFPFHRGEVSLTCPPSLLPIRSRLDGTIPRTINKATERELHEMAICKPTSQIEGFSLRPLVPLVQFLSSQFTKSSPKVPLPGPTFESFPEHNISPLSPPFAHENTVHSFL